MGGERYKNGSFCKTRRSITFDGVQGSVIGLCEPGRVGELLGFGILITEPTFH